MPGREERVAVALETMANSVGYFLNFDPSAGTLVNTAAANSNYVQGRIYRYGDKAFRYVQFLDAVAYAVGQPVFVDASVTTIPSVVTNDVSEAASATKPVVAGVCLGVQTENYYGWIQTRGIGTVLHNNDDDAAIGDIVIATAADGGVCNVGTWTPALGVGIGHVAVVAATNLQTCWINVYCP